MIAAEVQELCWTAQPNAGVQDLVVEATARPTPSSPISTPSPYPSCPSGPYHWLTPLWAVLFTLPVQRQYFLPCMSQGYTCTAGNKVIGLGP